MLIDHAGIWTARISIFVAALGLGACSAASQVPVGTNVGAIGGGDDDPCASVPVETLACASGRTVQTCNTTTTPPHWDLSCPDEPDGAADAGPCGDRPVNTIGCPTSEPAFTCDTSSTPARWKVTCPASMDGSSANQTAPDGSTACDGLPVETIGCASGDPTYTCVTDQGAPHWNVGCP
ncbi:MAG TPA: hypothetical protein VH044_07725 [Polyangiaceae bacterium]|jgi:hypothetical protein|nr:hypothetical protein [Polyangiaceae bacterium]